jgi:hypothetical protein
MPSMLLRYARARCSSQETAGRAVVRVETVDADGQVHFSVLPGAVEKNLHLLGRRALA